MRRQNDFYPTPTFATEILLRHVVVTGTIFEPCVGDGAIARVVDRRGTVFASDIDRSRRGCTMYGDASVAGFWGEAVPELGCINWVVTNPPFNCAADIVPLAYEHARDGIAMLLRLSYLEPVENRGAWLNAHPPTCLIVLPRISFTGNGKTDNVTCAWMVWEKASAFRAIEQRIIIAENPRFASTQPNESALRGPLNNVERHDGLGFELT